ncbi:MAG: hypothetical protein HQL84_10395 [Magnetococcales bacterium]|nr:hypothetical protein [Magnetococcales bacterium]MBF0150442.1 hypothetical protein [Magnetococcales bacterium]MBF0172767.1 hypothetical protein [Magnetococcales bacterium]MBF0347477.1 hypothetical protein [Magnetococcales bacterium]MBF0630042.1 hypothetical protein [Magnetococcales bacterium]
MKNFADLFILQQELRQPPPSQIVNPMDLKWLALDRFIALYEAPSMVNNSWTLPVWSGVAVDRGMVDTTLGEDSY